MQIQLLVTDGCANAAPTAALLQEVVDALVPDAPVERILVRDQDQARALAFPGSPTIRVDGVDLQGEAAGGAIGLS